MRRKGVGRFSVEVEGRSAHAGLEPEKGVNANVELAHQVLKLAALNDFEKGTSVNVGVMRGGTTPNVIPAAAEAEIDVRVWTNAEAERVTSIIRGLAPVLPGAKVRGSGQLNRPPMDLSPVQEKLFERAKAIAASIGLQLSYGAVGGGSDGNFTAALGVPTLDGLGCPGGGAHADDEHIVFDQLSTQVAFLAALLAEL
jgi:glutamate carboxypeptidase